MDPSTNSLFVVGAVALSTFVLAYSNIFGKIFILAFYAIWFSVLLVDYKSILSKLRSLSLLILLSAAFFFSSVYSDHPLISMRGSLQYASCILCAFIAACISTPRTFSLGITVGSTLVLLFSFAFGRYSIDIMDGSYTFVGIFQSKNQLGAFGGVAVIFALFNLFLFRSTVVGKSVSIVALILGLQTLRVSNSATSTVVSLGCPLLFFALMIVARLKPSIRLAGGVLAVPLVAAATVTVLVGGGMGMLLGSLGKDVTLTGRTYLWTKGMEAFWENPLLGVGYLAYWVPGRSEAETLWYEFLIFAKTGFHFHNTYIETLVESGIIGTGLLVVILLLMLFRLAYAVISQSGKLPIFFLVVFFMLLVRSFVEVEVTYQYTLMGFLFAYVYSASSPGMYHAAALTRENGELQYKFSHRRLQHLS